METPRLTDQLRQTIPRLRGGTRRLAEYMLRDPGAAARASVTTLAVGCNVAPSTVSRLAVRLGYSGFPDLRAALATEHGRALQGGWERDIGTEIDLHDPPEQLLRTVAAHQQRAARTTTSALNLDIAVEIADRIAGARRVLLHGSWADAVPLEELRLRLLRLGIAVWLHADPTAARVAVTNLGATDLLLAHARSGEDEVTADLLDLASERGATTALVSGDPDCPLARHAELTLATGVHGTTWTESFAGRASDTLACSLIWLLVAQRLPDALGQPPAPVSGKEVN